MAGRRIAPIRVVLSDDHALFRATVRTLLETEPDLEVVGETPDGEEVCELADKARADIVLLDLSMPNIDGNEVLRQLRNRRSRAKALVLTASENRLELSLALELGAKGIVPKKAASRALIEAIRTVQDGGIWIDPDFRDQLRAVPKPERPPHRHSRLHAPREDYSPSWSSLTPRERQIASLVAQGHRYRKIAGRLGISEQTVRNHLRNIFDKLHVNDRVQLALYTLKREA